MTDDQTLLDLAGKADKELFELAEAAIKEAPGEWTRDFQKSEGEYGSGPDAHTGFNVPVLYAGEKQLLTADASDIALINEEWDEDGVTAWDEASTRVVDYLAAANPERITRLISEKRSEAARADLTGFMLAWVVAVAGRGVNWSDLEDDFADAIADSMDMDWTARDGAKAVARVLDQIVGGAE